MPQFDIFGNYTLAFFFVFLYCFYYLSFVVFFDSFNKLFYMPDCLDKHIFLCNVCRKLNLINFNKFKNFIIKNFIY